MAVQFFKEEVEFDISDQRKLKSWIKAIIADHDLKTGEINYIFCNDEYLLQINKEYLSRDYYTDIITFDQSEDEKFVSGDIYISIERVRENATSSIVAFDEELKRVMIHGILHLIGYDDQTAEEKEAMTKKEEACLSLYHD